MDSACVQGTLWGAAGAMWAGAGLLGGAECCHSAGTRSTLGPAAGRAPLPALRGVLASLPGRFLSPPSPRPGLPTGRGGLWVFSESRVRWRNLERRRPGSHSSPPSALPACTPRGGGSWSGSCSAAVPLASWAAAPGLRALVKGRRWTLSLPSSLGFQGLAGDTRLPGLSWHGPRSLLGLLQSPRK